MQNNIKIRMHNFLSKFFIFFVIFLIFPFLSFSKELENENKKEDEEVNVYIEKKDNDLEYLPGEEVTTNEGKKMKVWSSKGTFRLQNEKIEKGCEKNYKKPPVVIVDRKRHR